MLTNVHNQHVSPPCQPDQRRTVENVLLRVRGREEAQETERFFGVDLQSAADSSRRGTAARRRAHCDDAVDAVPALPSKHGARLGPRWLATLNLVMIVFSAALFVTVAAMTSFWVSNAFRYSLFGFMGGCLLGLLGVAMTRWEETPRALVRYAQPLADTDHHPRGDGALALRGLANLAWMVHVRVRYVVAGVGGRGWFPGNWSRCARLLRHLLSRRPMAT